jgi:hypothetical protein
MGRRLRVSGGTAHVCGRVAYLGFAIADNRAQEGFLLAFAAGGRAIPPGRHSAARLRVRLTGIRISGYHGGT